jgi:hypothetical protein
MNGKLAAITMCCCTTSWSSVIAGDLLTVQGLSNEDLLAHWGKYDTLRRYCNSVTGRTTQTNQESSPIDLQRIPNMDDIAELSAEQRIQLCGTLYILFGICVGVIVHTAKEKDMLKSLLMAINPNFRNLDEETQQRLMYERILAAILCIDNIPTNKYEAIKTLIDKLCELQQHQ